MGEDGFIKGLAELGLSLLGAGWRGSTGSNFGMSGASGCGVGAIGVGED
jgi:hypothetical protein